MNSPIHKYIPHWMSLDLNNKHCCKCNENINRIDIIAIGIRQYKKNTSLYIEHKCPKCDYREITNFNNKNDTVEDLCYLLLDSIKKQRDAEKSREIELKNQKLSQMSDKEIKDIVQFIRSAKTHEEFMKYIKADKFKE